MNKERFNNVVMYSLAEPGAMGWGGYMNFVTDEGNYLTINYLSEETPWEDVKKCFPELKGCCFNGPMENEKTSGEILLYLLLDESTTNMKTRVNEGWKHIYMGFGNHLVVRADHYERFSKEISNLTSEEIYEKWFEIAMNIYCCKNE